MTAQTTERYQSFAEFYPYYLQEHSNPVCRRLHYAGSLLVLAILAYALLTQQWLWLLVQLESLLSRRHLRYQRTRRFV